VRPLVHAKQRVLPVQTRQTLTYAVRVLTIEALKREKAKRQKNTNTNRRTNIS
jgi:hypothetical protein